MSQYPMPPFYSAPVRMAAPKGASGLGIAALVLGIVSVVVAWIPFCGMTAIPVAGIGLILAIAGFIVSVTGGKSRVGMTVVGGLICLLAIGVALAVTTGSLMVLGKAGDELAKEQARRQIELENQSGVHSNIEQPSGLLTPIVDAGVLTKRYTDDLASTDREYRGRVVTVRGRVAAVSMDTLQQPYVILAGDDGGLHGVQCTFAKGTTQTASLRRTQSVSITGRVDGLRDNVLMTNCTVVTGR